MANLKGVISLPLSFLLLLTFLTGRRQEGFWKCTLGHKNISFPPKNKFWRPPLHYVIFGTKWGIFKSCPGVPKLWVQVLRGWGEMFERDFADT